MLRNYLARAIDRDRSDVQQIPARTILFDPPRYRVQLGY